jgi:lipopolysaccharide export system permease protein
MIAERYLGRTFAVYAGASLCVLATLYLVFDVVEAYRMLDAVGAEAATVAAYLGDRSAAALWHVLPAAVLTGLTLALGALVRRGEITALFAAGIGPGRVLVPLLLVGALACPIAFAVGELWMPGANGRVHALWRSAMQGTREAQADRWLRIGQGFLYLRQIGPTSGEARRVTLIESSDALRPRRRLDAAALRWRDGKWVLSGVTVRTLDSLEVTRHEEMEVPLDLSPDALRAGELRPELLNTAELSDLIAWKQRQGHVTGELEVALGDRRSWPFLPVLFVLIAVPLCLDPRKASSAVASLGRAVAVGAAFAVAVFICGALARIGILPPEVAGWLPSALLCTVGLGLCAKLVWPRRVRRV